MMEMADGVKLISAERKRQVKEEGYSLEHDDGHDAGELAKAAIAYAIPNRSAEQAVTWWPWKDGPVVNHNVHNPRGRQSRIRELVKAGALIAAEIDRLQRLR
jgi:hypothetical protein